MRSVAKHSYIKGARGKARAKAHVNYIQYRRGEDRDGSKPREFFSDEREHIQGREVKKEIDDQERSKVVVHKLILSPGVDGVNVQAYTRDVLKQVGREKGLDLNWRAVVHTNTDHDHAHVIVFGKDKNGREVLFNRDDYAKMREAGDRYLERNHFYERFLQRDSDRVLKDKYERERGDNLFEALVKDLNRIDERQGPERKPREAREWDKEKAIAHLPEREKVERDGQTYSRFSKLEELKDLAQKLGDGQTERLTKEQYQKLWQWIGTKERAGEDYYERQAKEKWDKKERKKSRTPGDDEREFKKLDKDLRKSFKELEAGSDFGKGYKQRIREQQGRLSPDHGHYTSAMEHQRLQDLIKQFPDRREEFEKQIADLKRFDQEQRQAETKGKWKDLDSLLGEKWKSPERAKEQERTQRQTAERQMQNEHIRQEHERQSGDQTEKQRERDRDDDSFGRGER